MKKLSRLKITDLSKDNLSNKEMRHVVGGYSERYCRCSCYWADQGGSSVVDNCSANYHLGNEYYSVHGDNDWKCIPLE